MGYNCTFVKNRVVIRRKTIMKNKWASVVGQKTKTTCAFVHISSNRKTRFNVKTFIHPSIETRCFKHALNPPDGSLNLSRYIPSDTSDWAKYCKTLPTNRWTRGTKHLFHIDMKKQCIFVIDTIDDFIQCIRKYGVSDKESIEWNLRKKNEIQSHIDVTIAQIQALLEWIDAYMIHKELTDEALAASVESFMTTKYNFDKDSCLDGLIVQTPRRGVTLKFIAKIILMIQHLYDLLHNLNNTMRNFEFEKETYDWIDYSQMKRDGYNGIYFSKKLMVKSELIKLCRPGDGEIRSYIEWLKTDTLAIWNWC